MSKFYKFKVYNVKSNEFYYVKREDLLNTILNISAKSEFDIAIANRLNAWWNYPEIANFDCVTAYAYELALNIEITELYDD